MTAWIWVLIVIAVVVVIALSVLAARKRRTAVLRQRFGPEYDRAVEAREDRRAAEADLRDRERQRAQFDIKPLPEATRLRFVQEWREVQERFVDQPAPAVAAADALITQVLDARGYPVKDFEAQADLVSVDHPAVVENYRSAHAMWQRSRQERASTEDLREALLRYRSLFDELLRPAGTGTAAASGATEADAAVTPDASGADAAGSKAPADVGPGTAADEVGPETGDRAYEDQPTRRGGR